MPGKGRLILAKQRNGPTGDVKLQWSDRYTRFSNFSEKPYEEFSGYAGGVLASWSCGTMLLAFRTSQSA